MDLVAVFSSISLNEVNYVKALLEAEEIDAVIFDEAIGAIAPHYLFHQNGVRLMVRSNDQQRALTIVKDYESFKKEE